MEAKESKLEKLKGQNPFRVPEGYMEGLTSRIMSRIPDDVAQHREAKVISLGERIRPLLYLAAVFIGLIFLFRVLINPETSANTPLQSESEQVSAPESELMDEDEEYLEYLQQEYNRNLLTVSLEYID
jgi:hypothetical protein